MKIETIAKYFITALFAVLLASSSAFSQTEDKSVVAFYTDGETEYSLDTDSVKRKGDMWRFTIIAIKYPVGIGMATELDCTRERLRILEAYGLNIESGVSKSDKPDSRWRKKDEVSERLVEIFCKSKLSNKYPIN